MSDTKMSCKECFYCVNNSCVRYPPQCATAVPVRHPITGDMMPQIIAGWPGVSDDNWCGEFKSAGLKLVSA